MKLISPRRRQLKDALIFWVDRAKRFEEYLPANRQYMRARGVGSAEYALGRDLFEESLPTIEEIQGILCTAQDTRAAPGQDSDLDQPSEASEQVTSRNSGAA